MTVALASAVLVWLKASSPESGRVLDPIEPPPPGTLVLPRELGSLRLAVMGDVGRGDRFQYETAAELVRWHDRFDFDVVLLLGDNIYGDGTAEDYRTKFEVPYKPLIDRGVKFYATPGNHDPENITSYEPFGMNGHRYYAFDREAGPPWARQRVVFVAIDTVRIDDTQLDGFRSSWGPRPIGRSRFFTIRCTAPAATGTGRGELAPCSNHCSFKVAWTWRSAGTSICMNGRFRNAAFSTSRQAAEATVRVGDLSPTAITANGFDQDTHFMLLEIAGDTTSFQVVSRAGATVDFGKIPRAAEARRPTVLRR